MPAVIGACRGDIGGYPAWDTQLEGERELALQLGRIVRLVTWAVGALVPQLSAVLPYCDSVIAAKANQLESVFTWTRGSYVLIRYGMASRAVHLCWYRTILFSFERLLAQGEIATHS